MASDRPDEVQPIDPKKAQALAALTIAVMQALDSGWSLATLMGALAGAYSSEARVREEGDTVVLAVTVAHESDVSLDDLLDTTRVIWETVLAERASEDTEPGAGVSAGSGARKNKD